MLSLWVISEVDLFLQRFTQQVLDAEEEVDNFEAVIGCLKAAFEATRQMDAAGVSVMFFVERKLVVPVSKAVRNTYIRLRAELLRRLEDDDYVPRSAPADSSVSLVSATTKFLREALMQRLTGLTPLMLDSVRSAAPVLRLAWRAARSLSAQYYLSVVDGLVSVVFSYCEMIRDRFLAFDEAARLEVCVCVCVCCSQHA